MLTRNGICYNFKVTPYNVKIGRFTFYFSSQNHVDKFVSERIDYARGVNYGLSRRFKLTVNLTELCDVLFYKKVESRGFLITTDEGEFTCPDKLVLNGQMRKLKNSNDRLDDSMQKSVAQ